MSIDPPFSTIYTKKIWKSREKHSFPFKLKNSLKGQEKSTVWDSYFTGENAGEHYHNYRYCPSLTLGGVFYVGFFPYVELTAPLPWGRGKST
jgi:hypothetical protein